MISGVSLQSSADWIAPGFSPILTAVIILAGLGTTVLFFLSIRAYLQRQGTRFLLVMVTLGALVARTIVGLGTMLEFVPMTIHHLISHSLDFFVAMLILYGVYRSGPDTETTAVSDKYFQK